MAIEQFAGEFTNSLPQGRNRRFVYDVESNLTIEKGFIAHSIKIRSKRE